TAPLSSLPPPSSSTLLPYTTLFRSPLEVYVDDEIPVGFGDLPRPTVGPDARVRDENVDLAELGQRGLGHPTAVVGARDVGLNSRSEEHTSELQSPDHLVCRLLLEAK